MPRRKVAFCSEKFPLKHEFTNLDWTRNRNEREKKYGPFGKLDLSCLVPVGVIQVRQMCLSVPERKDERLKSTIYIIWPFCEGKSEKDGVGEKGADRDKEQEERVRRR